MNLIGNSLILTALLIGALPQQTYAYSFLGRMISDFAWPFTIAWLIFCALWAMRSLIVRRGRQYSKGKKPLATNLRYKVISTLVFVLQVSVLPLMFWFDSEFLLKFHNSDAVRVVGLILCLIGLLISVSALFYLGRNYSPCFDSYEPLTLVTDGPYRYIRHPGWLSKFTVGLGGILASGSWWFVPVIVWVCIEMKGTLRIEEENLAKTFGEYPAYQARTYSIVPFIF